MCYKNILTSNAERLYLATFEFISGEYCQPFVKLFYAKDEKDLEEQIHEYLIDYYGIRNTSEVNADVYYYWNGEIAVKQEGWQEITSFRRLVNKLL